MRSSRLTWSRRANRPSFVIALLCAAGMCDIDPTSWSWTLAVNRLQVVADGASNRPDPGLWWTIGALKWIRRLVSGAVLRLPVRPECRDLIGARSDLTRHSSVRSPRRRANY